MTKRQEAMKWWTLMNEWEQSFYMIGKFQNRHVKSLKSSEIEFLFDLKNKEDKAIIKMVLDSKNKGAQKSPFGIGS